MSQANMPHQPDLFGHGQPELFDENAPTPVYRPDPDRVRRRLHKILAEARVAETLPWDGARVSLYRTIFPQMTGCLPEDEARQLCLEFAEHLERFEAA